MTGRAAHCWLVAAVSAWLSGSACAAEPGQRLVFVACPLVRDTTLPCWMSAYQGELYYLGAQGDLTSAFYPPQLGHRVLVEATVSAAPRICGGVVLDDVVTSVLPLPDISCNSILPGEDYADPPNTRGPGPAGVRGVKTPPARSTAESAPPPARSGVQIFIAPFLADTTRLWREAQAAVTEAAGYARQSHARSIEVVGYRAAIGLSDGATYVEDPVIARERAEAVARALVAVGVETTTRIDTHWVDAPAGGRGDAGDAQARRVVVTVTPMAR